MNKHTYKVYTKSDKVARMNDVADVVIDRESGLLLFEDGEGGLIGATPIHAVDYVGRIKNEG